MAKRTRQQAPIQWEKVLIPPFLGGAKVFDSFPSEGLRFIVSKDEGRWHLSMSHRSRYPRRACSSSDMYATVGV